jgi:outer membrane protein OmpA-like peptidoglycan-associated protein
LDTSEEEGSMRRLTCILTIAALSFCLLAAWTPACAGIGGLTDKLKDKATKKAEEEVDKALDGEPEDTTQAEVKTAETGAAAGEAGEGADGAGDMTLYTKYDFVPGDKVIFYDNLAGEEVGEFPSRWNLKKGVFEIVRQGKENYIMCTDQGHILPKIAHAPLPPKYTVEMEIYSKGPDYQGHWYYIEWLDSGGSQVARLAFKDGSLTSLEVLGKALANKSLQAKVTEGIHTMRIMATKSTIKCYLDNVRIANVPKVEGFEPVGFRVYMDPWEGDPANPQLLKSFRFAEGGKSLREQLDETGRIITHGILFDSGSDNIKGESYKTLANIGQLLTDDPELRLSIEGHTDSDGADDYNLDLSNKRALAARAYLMETYGIDGDRLEGKGWGEANPIDTNATPEGKANNRRVELVKL